MVILRGAHEDADREIGERREVVVNRIGHGRCARFERDGRMPENDRATSVLGSIESCPVDAAT